MAGLPAEFFASLGAELENLEKARKRHLAVSAAILVAASVPLPYLVYRFNDGFDAKKTLLFFIVTIVLLGYYYVIRRLELDSRLFAALTTFPFAAAALSPYAKDFLFVLPMAAGPLAGLAAVRFHLARYRRDFRTRVVAPLVSRLYPTATYAPDGHVMQNHFQRSMLYENRPDHIEGHDRVHGTLDDTPFDFSYLEAQAKVRDPFEDDPLAPTTPYHRLEETETIFSGLFFTAEFPKHFRQPLLLNPAYETLPEGMKRIRMDNPRFEKAFRTYGTDPIEAHYLLTFSTMQRLLTLQKRLPGKLRVSFAGGHLYILFSYPPTFMDPPLLHSFHERDSAFGYLALLHTMLETVRELKLNERIWSKPPGVRHDGEGSTG
jgi:hypothetical protein